MIWHNADMIFKPIDIAGFASYVVNVVKIYHGNSGKFLSPLLELPLLFFPRKLMHRTILKNLKIQSVPYASRC